MAESGATYTLEMFEAAQEEHFKGPIPADTREVVDRFLAAHAYSDLPIFLTVGVYPHGPNKTNGVAAEHIVTHVLYNCFWRIGRALFVEEACVYPGHVHQEKLTATLLDIVKGRIHRPAYDTQPYC